MENSLNIKFSKKQSQVITWFLKDENKNIDGIICDGAIRSGKTFSICISFILWSFYKFNFENFGIFGKSYKNLKRSVLPQLISILKILGFQYEYNFSNNLLTVIVGARKNLYYLIGGKDESSQDFIQGMTLSGILFDEVVLQPKSFVNQAIARVSNEGGKLFFNCNPANPFHWFYQEWILLSKQKQCLYFNFNLNDNPSLHEEIKKRYKRVYSGLFYDRFIKGTWIESKGLVYPFMLNTDMFFPIKNHQLEFEYWAISCDYGIVNPMSVGIWGFEKNVWYRMDEYYYDSNKTGITFTDTEYFEQIKKFISKFNINITNLKFISIDPSATSFITLLTKNNCKNIICPHFGVTKGINLVTNALKNQKIKISDVCKDSIKEFSLYSWDTNSQKDVPNKKHDHAMDDIRYFVCAIELYKTNTANYVSSTFRT